MTHIPFIIGYGGINAAGLSSTNQGYLNMTAPQLSELQRAQLVASLRALCNKTDSDESDRLKGDALQSALMTIQENFFIRRIPSDFFDLDTTPYYRLDGQLEKFPVSFAATLPEGFEPDAWYNSRYHPRGLQLAVFAANDALGQAGLDAERIQAAIAPHKCAVYAGSALGQLDKDSMEGLISAVLKKKKTVTKQLPFSYPQMAADFVNAYVLKNLGQTGSQCGACATFLYNLAHAVEGIKSGKIELALVGASEAPIVPQIITAFHNMGALASDKKIGGRGPREASIPFGDNYGFVMAESAQFAVLASEEAVCRLGASIYGMVSDVFISSDGGKHSISAPGPGNYITLGRAAAAVESLHSAESLRHKTYIQAHGTSTAQNRVTESHIFSSVAAAFGIQNWNIVAIKSYIGHSQAAAGGDQLANSLGFWQYGVLPGIANLQRIAEDVFSAHLHFNLTNQSIGIDAMDAALINAKGFGGNNATAVVSSPQQARLFFEKLAGRKKLRQIHKEQERTQERCRHHLSQTAKGKFSVRYDFEGAVLNPQDIHISRSGVRIKDYPEVPFDG